MLPKIIKAPSSVLSTPTRPVDNIDKKIVKLSQTMGLVTRSARGLGLAANQIGYGLSMFVFLNDMKMCTAINPRITETSESEKIDREGCLSIPGKLFQIARPDWVVVEYTELDGNERLLRAEGLLARCIMHEIGHLQGLLISNG